MRPEFEISHFLSMPRWTANIDLLLFQTSMLKVGMKMSNLHRGGNARSGVLQFSSGYLIGKRDIVTFSSLVGFGNLPNLFSLLFSYSELF